MIGFDYLRDTPPDAIEFLAEWRLPRRFRGVAAGVVTVVAVAAAALCIEWFRMGSALAQEAKAAESFEASKAKLASARLSYDGIERLVAVDQALARVRSSGDTVAAGVASIGNAIPRGAWLDALEPAPDGAIDLRGEATSLDAVDVVLAKLAASKKLGREQLISITRRTRIALAPIIAFELRISAGR